MATTVATLKKVSNQTRGVYPGGFMGTAAHALTGCLGCQGKKGDCTQMTYVTEDVVSFTLSDGRAGSVSVPVGATDLAITAAIQAWATANPVAVPAVVGAAIV